MKKLLALLLIAGSAHADSFTLFDVNGTAVENFRRVRSVENPTVAATLADQVRPYNYATPQDFVETITVTNVFDEVENIDIYSPVPQKYWKYNGEIVAMTQGERDAVDAQLASDWVTANTKSSKQLTAESRLVTIVTNSFPAVTFPLADEDQIDNVADQILVRVNQNRLLYGTQGNTADIGSFIADNEALSDVQAIRNYILNTFGGSVTDPHFGRQVTVNDAP